MKNQQNSPPACDLPHDVVENILSRLPVKSLLRFKTVCKSWNDTIRDPGFARVHSNQLNISNSQCFYATSLRCDNTYSLIKFQGQGFHMESAVEYMSREYTYANFLCCCEGIYTCVQALLSRNRREEVCAIKSIHKKLLDLSLSVRGYHPCYWTMLIVSLWSKTIIYFDPRDDLLKKLHKPEDLGHEKRFNLTNLSGHLCLYTSIDLMIGIWLLKEDRQSWTKLITVDNSESPVEEEIDQVFYAHRPMYLTSKNEVVFHDANGTSYSVYCLDKQEFGEVKDFPCSKMIIFTCLESLCFPASGREH